MEAVADVAAFVALCAAIVGALVSLGTLAVVARSSRKEAGGEP